LGHKVHPLGFRLGIIRDWQAKWYAKKNYAEFVLEDMKLREAIRSKYREAGISLLEIERQAKDISITLHTARPGIVIGRGGQRVDEMRLDLEKLIGKRVRLNIQEIRQPELDAYLVARAIAEQIERRIAYRRAMKQAMFRTTQAGAKGIKVSCSGRLGNAEIARRQTMHEGQVPLHTLRADIDYGFTEAHTTLGRIGIKVWINKGEIVPEPKKLEAEELAEEMVEAPAVEPGETPAEPTAETTEVTAEPEEKPAEPVKRKRKTPAAVKTEETPAQPTAETTEVTAEPKEKPAEPVKRKRKTPTAVTTEEAPAEPTAETTEVTAEPEEKPAEPVKRKRKEVTATEAPASTTAEEEENNAAT